MDWEFDILYAIQSIRTPFLDKLMAFFIYHRKCRRIVDCDRCSALYFKKIPPWRHADAFGRAFELYSGQSDNKKYGRQIETMSDR